MASAASSRRLRSLFELIRKASSGTFAAPAPDLAEELAAVVVAVLELALELAVSAAKLALKPAEQQLAISVSAPPLFGGRGC